MNIQDDPQGKLARLPDGQAVKIETVYEDGFASVRRIDGPHVGTIAVCLVSKLEETDASDSLLAEDSL
jgi:hypothetical protein